MPPSVLVRIAVPCTLALTWSPNTMKSILLVAERAASIYQSFSRALMLARYLRLPLDILLCDTALANAPRPEQSPPHAIEEARQYLEAVRSSVTAPDVAIATHAAFDGPLHQLVAHHASAESAALIIKSANHRRTAHDIRVDWQLSRSSPAPLLLTQGQPWHPFARFAAAIDVMDPGRPHLSRAVCGMMASLRSACGAELDLLYAHPQRPWREDIGAESAVQRQLQQLSRDLGIESQCVHVLRGEAKAVLPPFAAVRGFDVIAVGELRDPSFSAYVQSLPAELLRSLPGDVLFVKTENPALSKAHPAARG